MIYVIYHDRGMSLEGAKTPAQARNQALEYVGRSEIKRITEATEDEIAWVFGMGGHVPDEYKRNN